MNWSTLEIFTEGVKNRMDYSRPNPNHREENKSLPLNSNCYPTTKSIDWQMTVQAFFDLYINVGREWEHCGKWKPLKSLFIKGEEAFLEYKAKGKKKR